MTIFAGISAIVANYKPLSQVITLADCGSAGADGDGVTGEIDGYGGVRGECVGCDGIS